MSLINLSAKLDRTDSTTPWGFRLHGGKDFNAPLSIQRVNPGSLAERCGIQSGDIITSIGGQDTTHFHHNDAQSAIQRAHNSLELRLQRGGGGWQPGVHATLPASQTYQPLQPAAPSTYKPVQYNPSPRPFGAPGGVSSYSKTTSSYSVSNVTDTLNDRTQSLSISDSAPSSGTTFPPWKSSSIGVKQSMGAQPWGAQPAGPKVFKLHESQTYRMLKEQEKGVDAVPSGPTEQHSATEAKKYSTTDTRHMAFQSAAPAGGIATKAAPFKPAQPPKGPVAQPQATRVEMWQPKIPTGPRNPQFGKRGEARSMTGTISGRVPICSGCHIQIRGPFVLALNSTWCPDHFVCANPSCRTSLLDCGFVEEGAQLFCENDYAQYFAPKCSKCSQSIVGDCVNALQKTFHPHCFVCVHCRQPIGKGSFHMEDGQPYCEKDWQAMYQTKCKGCDFPVEPGDRWVEALGDNWHSECFNCSTCQVNLEGQPFFAKAGRPYCKRHSGKM